MPRTISPSSDEDEGEVEDMLGGDAGAFVDGLLADQDANGEEDEDDEEADGEDSDSEDGAGLATVNEYDLDELEDAYALAEDDDDELDDLEFGLSRARPRTGRLPGQHPCLGRTRERAAYSTFARLALTPACPHSRTHTQATPSQAGSEDKPPARAARHVGPYLRGSWRQ